MSEIITVATGTEFDTEARNEFVGDGDVEVAPHTRSGMHRVYERGMVTAEWAIAIIAAASLAGIAVWVFTKGPGKEAIIHLIVQIIGLVAKMAN